MDYNGCSCPACGQNFNDNDDVVVCPVCGTPHHRSCWQSRGGCVNESKHSEGFVWQMPFRQNENNIPEREEYTTCPRCGARNSVADPVCTNCGERLKANRQTVDDQFPPFGQGYGNDFNENPNYNNYSPYQNVYVADARTVYGDGAYIEDIPVTEIAEYVQKNSTEYIGRFKKMDEKKSKLSWNWSAGIFSSIWCFYRRMAGVGFVLIALFFASYLVSNTLPLFIYQQFQPETYAEYEDSVVEFNELLNSAISNNASIDTDELYDMMNEIVLSPINVTSYIMLISLWLIISVVFGFLGNYFYKKKVFKDIRNLRQTSPDSQTYHFLLRQKGGVSVANALIPIICYMLLNTFLTYI